MRQCELIMALCFVNCLDFDLGTPTVSPISKFQIHLFLSFAKNMSLYILIKLNEAEVVFGYACSNYFC